MKFFFPSLQPPVTQPQALRESRHMPSESPPFPWPIEKEMAGWNFDGGLLWVQATWDWSLCPCTFWDNPSESCM